MAGLGYFVGGVFLGAAWALVALTIALAAHRPRVARAAVAAAIAGPVLCLIVNRPRYVALGTVIGSLAALVLLGTGRALAGHTDPAEPEQLPAARMERTAIGRDCTGRALPPPER